MINKNELRIGNKLLFLNEVVTFKNITEIREDGVFWIKTFEPKIEAKNFHFKPIPLTEELLLSCGFEKEENNWFSIKYYTDCDEYTEQFCISINLLTKRCCVFDAMEEKDAEELLSYPVYTSKRIEYFHKLQNLFYELSNTELKCI